MSKPTESAFPGLRDTRNGEIRDPGLTKREYFAGQAMTAMLANAKSVETLWGNVKADESNELTFYSETAKFAYKHADAMIEESND